MKVTADEVFKDVVDCCNGVKYILPSLGWSIARGNDVYNSSELIHIRGEDIYPEDIAAFVNFYLEKHKAEQKHVGEVVVTTDEDGNCLAVTRQDDEGRVLKVIWMKKK